MDEYAKEKEAAVTELKRLIETYAQKEGPPPRAIGGPFNLSPEQLLKEVEQDTEVGRKVVAAFTSLRKRPASH